MNRVRAGVDIVKWRSWTQQSEAAQTLVVRRCDTRRLASMRGAGSVRDNDTSHRHPSMRYGPRRRRPRPAAGSRRRQRGGELLRARLRDLPTGSAHLYQHGCGYRRDADLHRTPFERAVYRDRQCARVHGQRRGQDVPHPDLHLLWYAATSGRTALYRLRPGGRRAGTGAECAVSERVMRLDLVVTGCSQKRSKACRCTSISQARTPLPRSSDRTRRARWYFLLPSKQNGARQARCSAHARQDDLENDSAHERRHVTCLFAPPLSLRPPSHTDGICDAHCSHYFYHPDISLPRSVVLPEEE